MTRRYPTLPGKKLKRDSKITRKLIQAWDVEQSQERVLEVFLKDMHLLSDQRYWELLRTVWVISGNLDNVDTFRDLMSSRRGHQFYFSTPEEAEKLRGFPGDFAVYRAMIGEEDDGISWTMDRDYAERYKEMYDKENVITRTVSKKEIFAFIERNNESEIIILQ